MTDRRSRERTLPEGYQFGDAAWRPPHENAAEQLAAKADPPDPPPGFLDQLKAAGHWNVIEGEDH